MVEAFVSKARLKWQLLFVVGVIVLISIAGICWWLSGRHELLIREASRNQAKGLVDTALLKRHWLTMERDNPQFHDPKFANQWSTALESQVYEFSFIRPTAGGKGAPQEEFEANVLGKFKRSKAPADPSEVDWTDRLDPEHGKYHYYQAVRAKDSCINCHLALGVLGDQVLTGLNKGDLMAVVKITIPDHDMQRQINQASASMLSAGIVGTLLAVGLSFGMVWLIIRP